MIAVSSNQWHVRWFLLMHRIWNEGFKSTDWYEPPKATNVCLYIRGMVLYPLVMALMVLLTITCVLGSTIALPAYLYGFTDYIVFLVTMSLFAGGAFGIGWSVEFLNHTEAGKRFWAKRKQCVATKVSFFKLIVQFIKDQHDKVCSLMEIEHDVA